MKIRLADGSGTIELRYLVEDIDRYGKARIYFRRKEFRQFEARFPIGTKARLALGLLLYLGPRRSDVVLFGRQHVREDKHISPKLRAIHPGRWLRYTQHKN